MCERWFCLAKSKISSKFIGTQYSSEGFSAYTQYEKEGFLRILSMSLGTSGVNSVWFRKMAVIEMIMFYTEYSQKVFFFILSISRKPSISY